METSLLEEHLSDGSTVYNVVFVDGSDKIVIAAIDAQAAEVIARTLQDYASYATVQS